MLSWLKVVVPVILSAIVAVQDQVTALVAAHPRAAAIVMLIYAAINAWLKSPTEKT